MLLYEFCSGFDLVSVGTLPDGRTRMGRRILLVAEELNLSVIGTIVLSSFIEQSF